VVVAVGTAGAQLDSGTRARAAAETAVASEIEVAGAEGRGRTRGTGGARGLGRDFSPAARSARGSGRRRGLPGFFPADWNAPRQAFDARFPVRRWTPTSPPCPSRASIWCLKHSVFSH